MNKAGIFYMSTHGTTEEVAKKIGAKLAHSEVELINLGTTDVVDLKKYNTVIIGGSIHLGVVQTKVSQFCKKWENELLNKNLGLFIMCKETGEVAMEQYNNAYSQTLREHASANAMLGFGLKFDQMNFLGEELVSKISGDFENTSHINYEAMNTFVEQLIGIY